MTFREAADRESGLCYNIGVQVNLLFDCPKKGASMKPVSYTHLTLPTKLEV